MRAGFVGLGNMGAPMAGHIVAAGHELLVYDLAGAARAPEGARVVASEAELGAEVDTVLICLPDGDISATVAQAMAEAPGSRLSTLIDCATIGVEAARSNAAWASERGITYVDAPISGGTAGSQRGTLTVIASCASATLERVRPLLEPFAANIFLVGEEPGQGQAVKLLNNFLSATALAATSEAMSFGERFGLDLSTMLDVVNVSTGQNTATSDKFPNRIANGAFDAGFTSVLMNKDLRLYAQAASSGATPVSPAIVKLWREMLEAHGNEDMTRIYPYVHEELNQG